MVPEEKQPAAEPEAVTRNASCGGGPAPPHDSGTHDPDSHNGNPKSSGAG
ncbi:hypothetical protein LTSEBAI_2130 [Salmonella enterica subsp. enterica serovar Baildon str. R6-199]|nr:hypothetical protein LTSEBAI_2130 [Salmonella enterica subsp. enterica serovar Baildon str. R6-199]